MAQAPTTEEPPFVAELDALRKAERYEDALNLCSRLLTDAPADRTEVLRQRARVFTVMERYEEAIADRRDVLASSDARFSDLYLAAWTSLNAGRFADAAKLFEDTIERGRFEKDEWSTSASWFFLAFARSQLGDLVEAEAALDVALSLGVESLPTLHEWITPTRIRADIAAERARRAR